MPTSSCAKWTGINERSYAGYMFLTICDMCDQTSDLVVRLLTTHLMEHEALPMEHDTDPLRLTIHGRISYLFRKSTYFNYKK